MAAAWSYLSVSRYVMHFRFMDDVMLTTIVGRGK